MSDGAPPPGKPLSNLAARLLTAVVAIPVLVATILWRDPIGVWVIVIAATAIGLREWNNMTMKAAPPGERAFGVVAGTALWALTYWFGERPFVATMALIAAMAATFLFFLLRRGAIETVAMRIAYTFAGFLYVGAITFLPLAKARPAGDGARWVFLMLCIAWLSDTGAYFAGRFLGPSWPAKLFASVSPKKTVVGGIGGLFASVAAVVVAKYTYLPRLGYADCLLLGIPANVLGQLGDLCESLIKRSVDVKDSGALLPGHGGMLDRIDALLFVCPYVYCYARWVY